MKVKKYIQEFKSIAQTYEACFLGNEHVSETSRQLPLIFKMENRVEKGWLGDSHSLQVTLPLEESQLHYEYYSDSSEAFSRSPLKTDSFHIIAHGMEYSAQREHDISRRDSLFTPFKNIQIPRYCIIVFLSERLKQLCIRTDWGTLIHEYEALISFTQRIIQLGESHFKTRNGSTRGFHFFLNEALRRLEKLKNISEYYLQRTSIVVHFESIGHTTESYKQELIEYLAYVLSTSKLGEAIPLDYITKDSRLLPEDFVSTRIYQSLRSSLLGELTVIDLNDKNLGISPLILQLEERDKVIKIYNKLLMALSNLNQFHSIFLAIAECVKIEGESQCVHDKKLNLLLSTSLKALDGLLLFIYTSINFLTDQSNIAIIGHENFRSGFTLNMQAAGKRAKTLQRYASTISDGETSIQQRLRRIEHISPEMREAMKTQEVLRVQTLITGLKRQELIQYPLADELLQSIETQCVLTIQGNEMLQPIAPPAPSNRLMIKFPTMYEVFDQEIEKIQQLEAIIAQYEDDIQALLDTLKKVNQALQIIKAINGALGTVANVLHDSLTDHDFIEVEQLYSELKLCIEGIQYRNIFLQNLLDIDKFIALFQREQQEYLMAIHRLCADNSKLTEQNSEGRQLRIRIFTPVKVQFENMADPVMDFSEQLKNESENIQLAQSTHLPIVEYYGQLISDHKRFVPPKNMPERTATEIFENTQTSYPEIMTICNSLTNPKLAHARKDQLKSLFEFLSEYNYILNYGGGEFVSINGKNKKFPRNIAKILNYYMEHIDTATTPESLDSIRNEIFLKAQSAYDSAPTYFCGLFKPRDNSTQYIYQTLNIAKMSLDRMTGSVYNPAL